MSESTEQQAKRQTTIRLPFPLPTWNRLLSMHYWERKKCRDLIHEAVYIVVNKKDIRLWDEIKYMELIRPKAKKN